MFLLRRFRPEEAAIDPAWPDDDELCKAPYYGADGMMIAQIKGGCECFYAIVGYIPGRYAMRIRHILADFEKRWLLRDYRHMWE